MSNPSPTGSVLWDNLPNAPAFSPLDKIWMRSLTGQGVMLNLVTLEPGAEVPLHSHSNEQAGYVLRGTLVLTIDGETRDLNPGDCYVAPPNAVHGATTTDEGCDVLDIFAPPRADYAERSTEARRTATG